MAKKGQVSFFELQKSNKPSIEDLSNLLLEDEIKELVELGIEHVILFGVPDDNKKDCCGSEAYNDNGALQQGIRKIKEIITEITIWMKILILNLEKLEKKFVHYVLIKI